MQTKRTQPETSHSVRARGYRCASEGVGVRTGKVRRWCWLAAAGLLFAGCQPAGNVNNIYGRRSGIGASSVNGTVVLSELFEAAGFTTSSWGRISPKLEGEQVIVWTPDRVTGPYDLEAAYFEEWLRSKPNRTLIYVGRDYDATKEYWSSVLASAPPEQRLRIRRKLAKATSQDRANAELMAAHDSGWFRTKPSKNGHVVESFSGVWSEATTTPEVWSRTVLEPNPTSMEATMLLGEKNGAALVHELRSSNWNGGKILLVANGSFLLNLPLTKPGNRQLATQLIKSCGSPGKACFLESDQGPMHISSNDRSPPFFLRLFTTFPINILVFHLCVLGMVYCAYAFPIFGRPKKLPASQVSDFGKHVGALGELLERTRDERFVEEKIDQYRNEVDS